MKIHTLLLCCLAEVLAAQNLNSTHYILRIAATPQKVNIDGVLDDAAWQRAEKVSDFRRSFPVDTGLSVNRTEVQVAFDEDFFYLAATCFQPRHSYTVQSLKRDFPGGTSDVLNLLLDPTKDGLNGFLFGVSPLNVQRECLISNGDNLEFDWDNRWFSAVKNYDDFWTLEMAVPFKTLRYNLAEGENSWHINFIRTQLKGWEVSSWAPVPQQYRPNNIAFCGKLIWETAPPQARRNVSFIPYVQGSYSVDYQRDNKTLEIIGQKNNDSYGVGGDVKIAVTPGLNLDLTFNPDFSQVEVDRQVTNLSRFELFFPERRQFFLENRDLFAMFGFPSTRPFFSRRVGLAFDSVSGGNQPVPILLGARLSGKLTDKLRIGFLNIQTQRRQWGENSTLPAANFTVATLQRRVFERSTLSAIWVNKNNFLSRLNNSERGAWQPWNQIAGLEYNLYSKDNRWEGEWYYHRSFSPDHARAGHSFAHFLGYNDRHWTTRLGYVYVGNGYNSEAGFVPRNAYQALFPGAGYTWYFQQSNINTLSLESNGDVVFDLGGKNLDRDISVGVSLETKNQTKADAGLYFSYIYLLADFDPTNLYKNGTRPLPAFSDYRYEGFYLNFRSSSAFDLQGIANVRVGEYFNGNWVSISGDLSYRWQPFGTFTLGMVYNKIALPEPFPRATVWLIAPRVELSFSRNVFFSSFFQYNTQANNFNINARLQYRFAPVSDIFLVYTDNSFAEAVPNSPVQFLSPKNRAVVMKAVYWL